MKQELKNIFVGFLLGTGITSLFYGEIFYSTVVLALGFMALVSMVYFADEETNVN